MPGAAVERNKKWLGLNEQSRVLSSRVGRYYGSNALCLLNITKKELEI